MRGDSRLRSLFYNAEFNSIPDVELNSCWDLIIVPFPTSFFPLYIFGRGALSVYSGEQTHLDTRSFALGRYSGSLMAPQGPGEIV